MRIFSYFILLFMLPTIILPMSRSKKIFSCLCTAAGTGLAIGTHWYDGFTSIKKGYSKINEDHLPIIKHKELEKITHNIAVKMGLEKKITLLHDDCDASNSLHSLIFLKYWHIITLNNKTFCHEQLERLNEAKKNYNEQYNNSLSLYNLFGKKSPDQKFYKQLAESYNQEIIKKNNELKETEKKVQLLQFTIAHECGHILYDSSQKKIYAAFAAPLLIQTIISSAKAFNSQFQKKKDHETDRRFYIRNLNKIPCGFAKAVCSGALVAYYMTYQEYLADRKAAEAVDSTALIVAAKDFEELTLENLGSCRNKRYYILGSLLLCIPTYPRLFTTAIEDLRKIVPGIFKLGPSMSGEIFYSICFANNIIYPIWAEHPTHQSRANHLRRIALEKELELTHIQA